MVLLIELGITITLGIVAARTGDTDSRQPVSALDRRTTVLHHAHPRVSVVREFITADEAKELIQLAAGRFERSGVVDSTTDTTMPHEGRTSWSAFLKRDETPLVARVMRRAAALLNEPITHAESAQLVRYTYGQFYKPHYDFLDPATTAVRTLGQRTSTVFVYLNTLPPAETGGGTEFPKLNLVVRPVVGTAAVWNNSVPGTETREDASLHGGQTIVLPSTVKYGLNIWFRTRAQQ